MASASQQYDEIWEHVYGDMQSKGPVHRHMRRLLKRLLHPLGYHTVLDVGCGQGNNFELLLSGRTIARATGIDVSERALERARRSVQADFYQLDVQKERLDGQWDLVFSSLMLEHVPDDEAALRNMRAMSGRYLLITTIAGDFDRYRTWDERIGHVRNYRVGELEDKLRRAGFEVKRSIYWGFPFYSPLARSLQNRSSAGTGSFSPTARLAASVLYWIYFLNSARRGDLLITLAETASAEG